MSSEEMVHLPDASFMEECHQRYRIKKGVCTTIDLLFCQYGMENRIERRKHLLSFLEYNQIKQLKGKEEVQAADEKLKDEIEEYLEDSFVLVLMKQKAIS